MEIGADRAQHQQRLWVCTNNWGHRMTGTNRVDRRRAVNLRAETWIQGSRRECKRDTDSVGNSLGKNECGQTTQKRTKKRSQEKEITYVMMIGRLPGIALV